MNLAVEFDCAELSSKIQLLQSQIENLSKEDAFNISHWFDKRMANNDPSDGIEIERYVCPDSKSVTYRIARMRWLDDLAEQIEAINANTKK